MARDLLTTAGVKRDLERAKAEAAGSGVATRIGDGDDLMLVVRPSGEASWVLRYSAAGKRRDLTVGRWPAATPAIARNEADRVRRAVAAGGDPSAERKAVRVARVAAADTVHKLFADWLAHSEMSAVYRGNIEAAFKKDVLPLIGALLPSKVERAHITTILRVIEKRNATVLLRRVRMWLRQMFEFAVDDERRPAVTASPVPTGNPPISAKIKIGR